MCIFDSKVKTTTTTRWDARVNLKTIPTHHHRVEPAAEEEEVKAEVKAEARTTTARL